MSDPIRDALREAGAAIAQEQCDRASDADRRACIAGPACTCRSNAAASVAAFHRRMSAAMPHMAWYHLGVAAAVERAAKEGA